MAVEPRSLRLSSYLVVSPPVVDELDGAARRVVLPTRTGVPCLVGERAWQALQAGDLSGLDEATVGEMQTRRILVPAGENELQTILSENAGAIQDDQELYMVIQPTAWCSLGCGYCGQQHAPSGMTEENQDRLVNRIAAKLEGGKYRALHIGWFGSEPLAGMHAIRRLTPLLQAEAQRRGCSYKAKVVTNGMALSPGIATELVQLLGVRKVEVTLDGPPEHHDARRHTKDGKPTFDRIFTNVVDFARRDDLDCSLSLRCNVDRRNYMGVSKLLHLIAEAGIQSKVRFYVAPIHSWGNDAHRESLSIEEFARWEALWLAEMAELGFRLGLIPPRKTVTCLAVTRDGELTDAFGGIFNCTEVSYVPLYGVPNQKSLGHLGGRVGPASREEYGGFNKRVAEGNYACPGCKMLPVCGGACPKAWNEGNPPCPSAKYNIEDRLLLAYAIGR